MVNSEHLRQSRHKCQQRQPLWRCGRRTGENVSALFSWMTVEFYTTDN